MCKGFSTSGLLRHLKNAHKELNLNMKRPHEDTRSEIGNVQRRMMMFVKQQAVEEIVSKLASVDGFSINAITKSEFIRKLLPEKGMVLPKNPSHVMNMIKKQYDLAKQSVILEITTKISSGSRFSVSSDEFTSVKKSTLFKYKFTLINQVLEPGDDHNNWITFGGKNCGSGRKKLTFLGQLESATKV